MVPRRIMTAEPVSQAPGLDRSLGDRVRRLRNARGLTQSELADMRVSKEYISQIETGKTRPTSLMVAWLAERLGVDPQYLEGGISERDYRETAAVLAQAEDALAEKRYEDAVELVVGLERTPEAPELLLRALFTESWARMYLGEVRTALERLERARQVAHADGFSDVDRAEVLYRLGCCRYKLNSIEASLRLFSDALMLAERSGLPCDRLRAHVLEWRSRCYRRHRDWEAAREDIERALELAEALHDDETIAHVHFQAALVADRNAQWNRARSHSERAKELYEAVDDPVNVGRLLNNLGVFTFHLGDSEAAIGYLKDAFRIALETDSSADGAQAVASLAQVHLRSGDPVLAEKQARHALELLDAREDLLDEVGSTQLVLGRALLAQERLEEAEAAFREGEATLAQVSSASHRAAAWTAQGDLALHRGDDRTAGALYRRAAEALQEVKF
jgi:transcriptional regulator with XRE-family HTH domain/Tfp pilus assembly protein PilF